VGFVIVPHQSVYVVERLGRFNRVLWSGFHLLLPFFDRVAYVHSLKEEAINISNQTAITTDNVTISIDGVLYIKVVDAEKASYGVQNLKFAVTQLAQTTMRSALGQMTLDKTFAEREALNAKIVDAINTSSQSWGLVCMRYEIRDITPPDNVRRAMEMQAEAERKKRAQILESEGVRESEINMAEGQAQAILVRARATSKGIEVLASSIRNPGGLQAVSLRMAEQYVDAFSNLAKKSTTLLLPSDIHNPSTFIATAFGIYDNVVKKINNNNNSPSKDLDVPSFSLEKAFNDLDKTNKDSETETETETKTKDKKSFSH